MKLIYVIFCVLIYTNTYSQAIPNSIDSIFQKGLKYEKVNKTTEAYNCFQYCDSLMNYVYDTISFSKKELYRKLVNLSTKDSSQQLYYFKKSLILGNDEIDDLRLTFEFNRRLSLDTLLEYLDIMDNNYFINNKKALNTEKLFRYIYFFDQYNRTKCYYHKTMSHNKLKVEDIKLQKEFKKILKKQTFDISENLWYHLTFDLLLIHSSNSLKHHFFKKMFHVFSKQIANNDFNDILLQEFADIYISSKSEKQYFGTFWGQHRVNDKFVLAPKVTKEELKNILKELKVYNYILPE